MTEEDLQAEVQASKKSREQELQELAGLEAAQRLQATMDAEAQRQIHLDELLARRLVEQEEEAAKEALATEFDYIQARLNADQILAEKIQQEEREQYSIEDRAKFLHDTIAAQRKFRAYRTKKSMLRLKSKSFEEIQVLYERYKKQDQTFVAIGSEEDERAVKKMNEQAADKEKEQKAESVHEEVKENKEPRKGTSDEDKVIDVEILDHQYPIVNHNHLTDPYFHLHHPLECDLNKDIYAIGSENCPPTLNKENYVPWSSRLLRYAKSRPNGNLMYNSIMNGPYVRRMIPEPGDANCEIPVNETFHEQTDDELTEKELKQVEADDQAIQTILLGLPEDIYAAVDSCETAQEIWLRVQQMMKGSDIGIQEKETKLFNEWERFASTDGESIESYYHCFSKLMNDFKRNKYFPEKIARPTNTSQDIKMKMVDDNVRNEVRHNAIQNDGNAVMQNAIQNPALAEGNDNGINGACEENKRAIANCTLENNLQQALTSGTQSDKAPVYDSDGLAELLEPIPEPHQVQQNDSNVISVVSSVEQSRGTIEQHSTTVKETRAYHESLFHNLAAEVERIDSVNCKLKETNVELTTKLARYKNQVKCFEISQEKYDKLERCYQKSVYQEQCFTKKINTLHLGSGKQITALNEEISNLNKQISKEKATVSSL
ncbi:hypothetical protein Tco_0878608 [Tanacetum coccineum]|uniref:Uncharacterized protein n=1 Tax=Tanacetum coccineum TaxID=301880 RepID=A0ABQ5C1M5_9ASTR